jgi:hypothetical protein
MALPRNRSKAFGLLVLIVCAVTLGTGSAQAEVGASWKVEGAKVTSSLLPALAVKEVEAGGLTLLTKIAGIKVEVSCTSLQPVGIKLETEGKLTNGGQLRFFGCLTKLNEKSNSQCEPSNEGKEPGAILTKPGKGLLVLIESKGVIQIEPKEGETLATIETGEECAVGQKINVIGKLTLKDSALGTEVDTHLFAEGATTELWVNSKTAEHKATIDGSAIIRLAGTHTELPWSGVVEPVPPGWRVNGANVNSTLKPKLKAATENEEVSLLTSILGISTKILCKTLEVTNTLGIERAISEGKAKFTGCATYLEGSGTPSGPCLPKTTGVNDVIESNTLVGSLVLVGGIGEVLVKAKEEGKSLVVVESSVECPVGQKINVTGELFLKDGEGKITSELVTHLVQADNSAGTLKASGQTATIDGSANISLAAPHEGLKWSGIPE